MGQLRDQILNADDRRKQLVKVPEWNTTVEIWSLTGSERSAVLDLFGGGDSQHFYPMLIIASAHDPETGEKLFDAADRDLLNTKNGTALDRLARVALRLSALSSNAAEETEKN